MIVSSTVLLASAFFPPPEHIIDGHACVGDVSCFQSCPQCSVQEAWSAATHLPSSSSSSSTSSTQSSEATTFTSTLPPTPSTNGTTELQFPVTTPHFTAPETAAQSQPQLQTATGSILSLDSLQGFPSSSSSTASVIHYNGPVTNKIFNVTMPAPLTDTTSDVVCSSSRKNTEQKLVISCHAFTPPPTTDHSKSCGGQRSRDSSNDKEGSEDDDSLSLCVKPELNVSTAAAEMPQQRSSSLVDSSLAVTSTTECKPHLRFEGAAAGETEKPLQKDDVLHDFGNKLFDAFPYSFFQKHYRHRSKEVVRTLFLLFFLYQGFSIILMTICEDRGLHHVFKSKGEERCKEIASRFLKFLVKFTFRIMIPVCCVIQLPVIASKPRMPHTSFSVKEASKKMLRIHDFFSSEEEISEIRNNPDIVFSMSESMVKRRIHSMWLTLFHSILFVALCYHIGAFHVCEANTLKGGVCKFLDSTIIYLPKFSIHVHMMMIPEVLSCVVILLLIGITKDCYTYENRIAVYASIIGGGANDLYQEIRRRWRIMDWCVVAMAVLLIGITILSLKTGRTFTPAPLHAIEASDLIDFYFWICVSTILTFLATSSKRMLKHASFWSYLVTGFLIFVVKVESTHVPFGSIIVLLFSFQSAVVFNFLICLFHCHYHYVCEGRGSRWGVCALVCVCALSLALLASMVTTLYLEVANSAMFSVK